MNPNPLVGSYKTKDDRFLMLMMLQPDRYWPDLCERIGRPDLVTDPRFADGFARFENRGECVRRARRDASPSRTLDEWREALAGMKGVWAPVQTAVELYDDPQVGPTATSPTSTAPTA